VLGNTANVKSSKRILGRYKDVVELRDVFEVSRLKKQARKLLIFKVVDSVDEDTWYLISFDIKEVIGRRSGRPRYATKEYTIIKDRMFWNLCGRIDNSTYICPKDSSDIPREFTNYVSVWPVVPYDNKTLNAMKSSVEEALVYVKLQLMLQLTKIRKEEVHGRAREKARKLVRRAETLLRTPWISKVERLLDRKIVLSEVEELKKTIS